MRMFTTHKCSYTVDMDKMQQAKKPNLEFRVNEIKLNDLTLNYQNSASSQNLGKEYN